MHNQDAGERESGTRPEGDELRLGSGGDEWHYSHARFDAKDIKLWSAGRKYPHPH